MRRRLLIGLLALGTVGGYASGFSSLRHRSQCRQSWSERAVPTCAPCPGSTQAPPSAESPTPSAPR